MLELTERLKKSFRHNKNRVLKGEINCIPSPLEAFRKSWPGIQKKRIYLVSGGTKASKTQITNYLFIISVVFYCYQNPGKVHPKIFYFPLEMTKEELTEMMMCYVINWLTNGAVVVSPADLESVDERHPLDDKIFTIMDSQKFKDIMSLFEDMVTFSDESNRVGIYKTLKDYALSHGTSYYKEYTAKEMDPITGEITTATRKLFDYYVPDDELEYVIAVIDHVSLLNPIRGEDLRETISEFAKNLIELRNRYNYILVPVQQQNIKPYITNLIKLL